MHRRDGSGVIVLPRHQLTVGKLVRVTVGPFADLEGLFQEMLGRDRVVLLFNLLGRRVRTSVKLAELAA
jgi:transcription antitermination factor NusG